MDIRGVLAAFAAAVVVMSGTMSAQAGTEKKPQPPPTLCIGSNCAVAPGPSAGGVLKFHPGIYPYFNYAHGVNMSRFNNGDAPLIAGLKNDDNVAGIAIAIMWTSIDKGTSEPSYDWSMIDAYLKAVKAVNKRLWVRVQDAAYSRNWSVANGSVVVPHWLINKYGAENVMLNYSNPPRGVAAKRYSAEVTNAYIDMFQAMAARYDSDPNFEGVTMFEETAYGIDASGSSVSIQTPGADYNPNGMFTQLYSLMAGLRDPVKGFKHTNVMLSANYLFNGSDSAKNWTDIFNHIKQYHMVLGGPDSWIPSWTYPNLPIDGPQHAGPGASPNNPNYRRALHSDEVYRGWWAGTTDWRGKILFGPDVEMTDFGGYITANMGADTPTLEQIWQVRGPNLDRAQYFFFDINYKPTGNIGTAAQQWSTAQYPWVKKAGQTNTLSPYQ